jgi:hypothetical protein
MKKSVITILLLGILMTQISISSAAVPWTVGQTFTYEVVIEQTSTIVENTADGLTSTSSYVMETTNDYEIIEIDKVNLEVTFDLISYDGSVDNVTDSYNSTIFGLSLGDFSATYLQFQDNNTFYLRSFYAPDSVPMLVDPDFADVNDNFKDELNASKIIDLRYDPDDFKFYKFTLGNLFNNMTSWSINTGTTFSAVHTAITDEYSNTVDRPGFNLDAILPPLSSSGLYVGIIGLLLIIIILLVYKRK